MKKSFKYISVLFLVSLLGCTDIIDLNSESNIVQENYFTNYSELQEGLTACYNGLQKPLTYEWILTELRSDNTIMDGGTSTSTVNNDLGYVDQFYPPTIHEGIKNYWLSSYNNIRNTNVVLTAIGATYIPPTTVGGTDGIINIAADLPNATLAQRKKIAAEASFIRAYHYFNLIRLFGTEAIPKGGVFLLDKVITPEAAKQLNRSSVAEIYDLIIADLKNAVLNGSTEPYSTKTPDQLGHANKWAASALLGKVYLTLGNKALAIDALTPVVANTSGYSLESSYANVFAVNNEMNKEMLFAIRFKGGGVGMGNPLPNLFAPTNSGAFVIKGDGKGYNTPTTELAVNLKTNPTTFSYTDPSAARALVNYNSYSTTDVYVNKFMSKPFLANDAENDFPVLRYADVLLMLAEAYGPSNPHCLEYINLVRNRALLPSLNSAAISTVTTKTYTVSSGTTTLSVTYSLFEKALSDERRYEFAFENQRWFDLLRFNKTFTTLNAEKVMKYHFVSQYDAIYKGFTVLPVTLDELLGNVTNDNNARFALPIPQYEIDTNTQIQIQQNPSY